MDVHVGDPQVEQKVDQNDEINGSPFWMILDPLSGTMSHCISKITKKGGFRYSIGQIKGPQTYMPQYAQKGGGSHARACAGTVFQQLFCCCEKCIILSHPKHRLCVPIHKLHIE